MDSTDAFRAFGIAAEEASRQFAQLAKSFKQEEVANREDAEESRLIALSHRYRPMKLNHGSYYVDVRSSTIRQIRRCFPGPHYSTSGARLRRIKEGR